MTRTMSTLFQWIANKGKDANYKYKSLAHHLTPELLELAYARLNKRASGGVDERSAEEFGYKLKSNVAAIHTKLKDGQYKAPPVKRVWIPKDEKSRRPLGLPTIEDKVVQGAVKLLLEPIYEEIFSESSYGYRPKRSAHQALDELWRQTMALKGVWLIDADISDYFGSIDHQQMKEMIKERVIDGSIIRLIGKWLKAGVMEEGRVTVTESGTPQGGVISPLLANIYLHYVLDSWFEETVKERLKGRAFLIRFADDFVIGCELEEDARRIMEVLPKRMLKYGLTIHPTKTKLSNFKRPRLEEAKGASTFDFLGFRHYWGKSRKGNWVVKVKTAPKKQHRTLKAVKQWCKKYRHIAVEEQHKKLCQRLEGHYNYYGITSNYNALKKVYNWTVRQWHKWLNRRGGKYTTWEEFGRGILATYPISRPRVTHSVMT